MSAGRETIGVIQPRPTVGTLFTKGTAMLRRLFTTCLMLVLGAALSSGVAAAVAYPPPAVPDLVPGATQVAEGGSVTFTGAGFSPGEIIDITVEYAGPDGLRRSSAMVEFARVAGPVGRAVADDSGAFTHDVIFSTAGRATVTATGRTSGFSVSTVVQVGNVTRAEGPAPAAAAAAGRPHSDAGAGTTGGGLAWTGTSLVGPLTVGAGLLAAGLLMLFFGARMIIRRRVREI